MRYILPILLLFLSISVFSLQGYAQSEADNGGELESEISDVEVTDVRHKEIKYEYEELNMKSLATLQWGLSNLDINHNPYIDTYVRLTNCDLYNDYSQNEFQWNEIREAARKHLKEKMLEKKFNFRFKSLQPIKLGDYDVKTGNFFIQDKYQINSIRRFEVKAAYPGEKICGYIHEFDGYPRGILAEFRRPVGLTKIPVPQKVAELYIADKQEQIQKLAPQYQTRKRFYEIRDAYLQMKFKVFAANGEDHAEDGSIATKVFATLESIEVFADRDLKLLMYKKSFIRNRELSPMEKRLREEYKQRLQEKIQQDLKEVEEKEAQ